MYNNESLRKLSNYYQETKNLYSNERSKAKKHLIYANLRLKFLEWLERGYMDELEFKFETEKKDPRNLEESYAWQEAVFMFAEELREDDFYVDIIGNTDNYTVTWSYRPPQTPEQKADIKNILKEHMDDRKDGLAYQEMKKLDSFFHSLMNMKPKEEVLFHGRYKEFETMIKENSVKGDSYQSVVSKISQPSSKLNGKSALDNFLSK